MQFVRQFNWFIERIALNSSIGNKKKQYKVRYYAFSQNENTQMNIQYVDIKPSNL